MLSPEDLAYQEHCRQYAATELVEIEKKYGEINEVPEELRRSMANAGLFKHSIPAEYGGDGVSATRICLAREALAGVYGPADVTLAMQGLGSFPIVLGGNEEQKQRYLPKIVSGDYLTTFALTEPNAGSDAANISTSAVLEGEHWILNGSKLFITNGDCADIFTTIAVTDHAKGARGGVSAFIVKRDMPGFSAGAADRKMGLKGSHTTELIFKNCRVPRENVIGGMPMVGQGFKTAMSVLDKGRLTMGACALGASQRLLDMSVVHLKKLVAAGVFQKDLQARQFMLADMATEIFAARQMLYHAARMRDQGLPVSQEASMVKLFCTETASRIADRAMDIHGDEGYLKRAGIEMFLRDVRLYRIYEGTSEIQRLLIARHLLKDDRRP